MQFPESWLRSLCNPALSTQELADLLTMSGLEVEELRSVAPAFTGVVVGLVEHVEPHPDADRLRVCRVNVGAPESLQIVCGAPNVAPGLRVPCAVAGAVLPPSGPDAKPFHIRVGKLRGVESQGMLCSATELGLPAENDGLMVLDGQAPVGQDIRQHLDLDDNLFTLKLTPNLAHCLSLQGIAREVSALTGAAMTLPSWSQPPVQSQRRLGVDVQAQDLCGRFVGQVIEGVNTKASTPAWMRTRLLRCGQRPVSVLVDISNYVMFELGQPSHVFDLASVKEGLVVRWAKAGETATLLNGQTVNLDAQVGVIASGETIESLAGIMGAQASAVSDGTRDIYVEAAFWRPSAIAGRARRFHFSTEASHRFERGVDPEATARYLDRVVALILEICGGQAGPRDEHEHSIPQRQPVTLRLSRAQRVVGMALSVSQCQTIFERLGLACVVHPNAQDTLMEVTPASWRFDLQIEEDLIEEVIRVLGYDKLPRRAPLGPVQPRVRREASRGDYALRRAVASRGYQEVIGFSFVQPHWEQQLSQQGAPIALLNPISSQLSVMRSTLLGSLMEVLKLNLSRKAERVRVFEFGRVFWRDERVGESLQDVAGLQQPRRLAGLAWGPADHVQWSQRARPVDFFDVKGDVEALFWPLKPTFAALQHPAFHPGRCASIELDGVALGVMGELHPKWRQLHDLAQAPVMFELDVAALAKRQLPHFSSLPRQQSVWRDLALVVGDAITHDQVIAVIRAADASGLVRDAWLFDLYKPQEPVSGMAADERSFAVRIELRDEDTTLTDERIDATLQSVVQFLQAQIGARIRA